MKKIISVALVLVMLLGCVCSFASCGDKTDEKIKVGFICLHDETSTYDLNFINAAKAAQKALNLSDDQVIIRTNIKEGNECYEAAADLVDQGCTAVFADSFGHEEFMIKAAKEFPNVTFCHATGTQALALGLPNYHNAFASIYEGRYLAGVAAGLKLNEMIENKQITAEEAKMGYVGAFTYAEVISGYTSFYLGAKSVCPSVTMEVTFTGSWYDTTEEKNAAEKLIADKCVLISQHADSMGAPSACEAAGVPNVSYNGSTIETCENTFIVSSKINWAPYFEKMISSVSGGKALETDWCGTLATDSVQLTDVNTKVAAAGTAEKLAAVKADLESGKLHVFDTSKFTVDGKPMTSFVVGGKEVVSDGYFHESDVTLVGSAPCFNVKIDGITLLNEKFGD